MASRPGESRRARAARWAHRRSTNVSARRGGCVEPLGVVEGHDDGLVAGEVAEGGEQACGHRGSLRDPVSGVAAKQRHLQRPGLRGGEGIDHLVEHLRRVGRAARQRRAGLRPRPGRASRTRWPSPLGSIYTLPPHRGLARTGLTHQHHPGRPRFEDRRGTRANAARSPSRPTTSRVPRGMSTTPTLRPPLVRLRPGRSAWGEVSQPALACAPYAREGARQGRQPLQAAGLRVPVGRDLRRVPLHLRLRAARRAAAAQREGRLVAVDGAAARRRGRPRRRHPRPARRSGRLGPPGQLHRPARRLRAARSGSASTSSTTPASARLRRRRTASPRPASST